MKTEDSLQINISTCSWDCICIKGEGWTSIKSGIIPTRVLQMTVPRYFCCESSLFVHCPFVFLFLKQSCFVLPFHQTKSLSYVLPRPCSVTGHSWVSLHMLILLRAACASAVWAVSLLFPSDTVFTINALRSCLSLVCKP